MTTGQVYGMGDVGHGQRLPFGKGDAWSTSNDVRYVTAQSQGDFSSVVVKTFFRSRDQDKTETWVLRSRDRDLDKMNLSALESRDNGLEITPLAASVPIGDRALA